MQLASLPVAIAGAYLFLRAAGNILLLFIIAGLIALLLNPFVALGASEAEAIDKTIARIFEHESDPDPRKVQRRMMPATRAGCMGPADKVLRQLGRFADLGIELTLCKIIPTVENVQRIGREIIAPMKGGEPLRKAG